MRADTNEGFFLDLPILTNFFLLSSVIDKPEVAEESLPQLFFLGSTFCLYNR